ncbi:NAD(P)-dependent oxidoreductase [Kibdelosporangium phytohabitans]|uniref:Hydroxyacid dehydrogenase n=1 Tax=Kibdelosporangium phytohabitans TaxID=860235 RepID=A0A0N9I3E3_9PSEU|nr:NAD(P)-binding domain-containing protein [Kibdelosporangium phytohabitans]ALG09033.1 hydroxyacid dehydrogenase [Kibdelosporangium phytohabitans]MBE1469783.1 3-hydroxyisobutyrate dehydrogenase-like beta-hydroxyacid dehydrogenase [Kibdelosporangium phytohabitans]
MDQHTPVTVIGLGSMGRALAEAYIKAGHPTTVWNRTAGKVPALRDNEAADVSTAVKASPLVIACLTTYEATKSALEPADLAGRTLVTLNSGAPAGAREMAEWAAGRGAEYLDGAVKNVPAAVGDPGTLLYYSGSRAVYDQYFPVLRVLGGDTVYLGAEPDLAALYEYAVGGTLLPALLGFFQGAAVVTARGLPAASMVRFTAKWLEMIASVLPDMADEIDSGRYGDPASAVGLFEAGIAHDASVAAEFGVDTSWQEGMHEILRRAVAAGYRDDSVSSLIEMIRRPQVSI